MNKYQQIWIAAMVLSGANTFAADTAPMVLPPTPKPVPPAPLKVAVPYVKGVDVGVQPPAGNPGNRITISPADLGTPGSTKSPATTVPGVVVTVPIGK